MNKSLRLPASISLDAICYAKGERGAAIQVFRCEEHGVTKIDRRAAGETEFRTTWAVDEDAREFRTYNELRKAVNTRARR